MKGLWAARGPCFAEAGQAEELAVTNPGGTAPHEIELKDPVLAAFLAWLLPGLGHFYQGRTAKGILFCVCIVGTFLYGAYLGSSRSVGLARVVYVSWRTEGQIEDKRLYYLCQMWVGLPALPAVVQAYRVRAGRDPLAWNLMAPPRLATDGGEPPTLHRIHRELHRYFELGSVFTAVAGLLNILAIYDAWGGPVMFEGRREEGDEEGGQKDKA